ncbi:MAG: phosphoesterase [Candidatus Omnitrophota bacterium]|jgi:predicted ATPase|nr:MAG: phosphoesterase [Candidatus Omnitrophota bacterium]
MNNSIIKNALELPGGARFYRCALQVNPYEYVKRHCSTNKYTDEDAYNQAIVQSCLNSGIEVIAITDHHRIHTSTKLSLKAKDAGIIVFNGVELETKEGIHIICLFNPDEQPRRIESILAKCGILDIQEPPQSIDFDCDDLLHKSSEWSSVCFAPHITCNKGLLTAIQKNARSNLWKSPCLLAVAIPGPVSNENVEFNQILQNKDPNYLRERPIAIINAQDVSSPDDVEKPGSSCWIKMSAVSVEGLRQAFLDPSSRIRLSSDDAPEEHAEFVAMAWQGGFLDEAAIHFNENLNVLIGGRGTGKSTIIESLRYVLGLIPLGEDAQKSHKGITSNVLKNGTKISLLLRSYHPSKREYVIERTIPNPPIVRDETGTVLNILPADIIPQVEIYGQHEISELTKSKEKLAYLLERFVEKDASLSQRKIEITRKLERSRNRLLELNKERLQIKERLAALPSLEETLRRFQEAGLEEKLKERSVLVKEERILKTTEERLVPFKDWIEQVRRELPIDRAFVAIKALEGLPGKTILAKLDQVLEQLTQDIRTLLGQMDERIQKAEAGIYETRVEWEVRKQQVQEEYQKLLRELQKSKVDGEEFIHLRQQIEELRPLKDRQEALERDKREYEHERTQYLAEWEDVKTEEYRALEHAAKKVNRKLRDQVTVEVIFAGNRDSLFQLFRDQIGGRLSETLEILGSNPSLSLKEFVDTCRSGAECLTKNYAIPGTQAERIAGAGIEILMQIEELDLPPTATIKLNVSPEGSTPNWQSLDDLSTGQKATAILLLLLLESQSPLVIDQPEDDLDNRFITDGIVPKMREEKRRRQFIFATHNANIPVLGDAELIAGLVAQGEAGEGKALLPKNLMGSIDTQSVRELVEEVLEGGKIAFEMRRLKYGF